MLAICWVQLGHLGRLLANNADAATLQQAAHVATGLKALQAASFPALLEITVLTPAIPLVSKVIGLPTAAPQTAWQHVLLHLQACIQPLCVASTQMRPAVGLVPYCSSQGLAGTPSPATHECSARLIQPAVRGAGQDAGTSDGLCRQARHRRHRARQQHEHSREGAVQQCCTDCCRGRDIRAGCAVCHTATWCPRVSLHVLHAVSWYIVAARLQLALSPMPQATAPALRCMRCQLAAVHLLPGGCTYRRACGSRSAADLAGVGVTLCWHEGAWLQHGCNACCCCRLTLQAQPSSSGAVAGRVDVRVLLTDTLTLSAATVAVNSHEAPAAVDSSSISYPDAIDGVLSLDHASSLKVSFLRALLKTCALCRCKSRVAGPFILDLPTHSPCWVPVRFDMKLCS